MSFHKLPESIFSNKVNLESKDADKMEHNFFEIENRLSHVDDSATLKSSNKTAGEHAGDSVSNGKELQSGDNSKNINEIDEYYIENPKNVPDSRNTVKKWFASNPEKQIQLINLFIDQLTWTNHLNFTEAIKMLRSNFDFPFVGARVLRRQYDFIIKTFEKKEKKDLELNSFDMLVMRLRDKKKECDNNKNSAILKKLKRDENKLNENNQKQFHMDTGLSNDKKYYEYTAEKSYTSNTSNGSSIASANSSIDNKADPNIANPTGPNDNNNSLRLSILNNIHQQIQSSIPDSNYSIYSDVFDQTNALKHKVSDLEHTIKELTHANEHYEKLLKEKDELLKTKDETIVKLVDNMIKLQEKL